MDDMYIENLSKPVDHSKLKRRIEREQKIEFMKSKPAMLSQMRRNRSRSSRVSMRGDSNEKQLIVKKYKTFVNKIEGRTYDSRENNDLWRGANDFTRISA